MKEIKLYTWRTCPYCKKAKNLLNDNGYEYTDVDITDLPEVKAELAAKHGQTSVPFVFVGDELIGGSSDLEELIVNDLFDEKVQD